MATLITGGAGFVGMALAEAILADGEDVVLLDARAPSNRFLSQAARLGRRPSVVTGDIRDPACIRDAFAAAPIGRVFHGPAITADAARERGAAADILDVNLFGTLWMLEAARDHGVARFVYPSSLTVYGSSLIDREVMVEDETPAIPESLYAISKYAGERLALRFGALHGLDVVCGRLGSVFGPWEEDTGVRDTLSPFWQVADQARQGGTIVLPSHDVGREMVYSRDVAAALALLLRAERHRFPVYNLSVAADWRSALRDWCDHLGARWRVAAAGEDATVIYDFRPRGRQDTGRLTEDFGFQPGFLPDAALADYAAWLRG